MKKIVILHWWWADSQSHWFQWMKSLMNWKYEVVIPDLPNTELPNLHKQARHIEWIMRSLNEHDIVVGHSIWGQLAAYALEKLWVQVGKLILIAPTHPWLEKTLLLEDIDESERTAAHEYYKTWVISNVWAREAHLFLSQDDPYIHFENARNYYQSVWQCQLHEYTHAGHFNTDSWYTEFHDLLEIISE